MTLPATAQPEFGLIAHDEKGYAPSANPFRLVDLGNVPEVEPNDAVASPTPFTVPMAVNGVISKPGDTDFFKFAGKRGQVLDVRVFARSLGSPLDPQISVHRADGAAFAGNDDSGGPDSYLRVTLTDDGDYLIAISDHLGQGGVDYVYRIEVTPITPSLSVSLPERRNTSTPRSRCHKETAWRCWCRLSGSISVANCNWPSIICLPASASKHFQWRPIGRMCRSCSRPPRERH